MSKRLCLRPTEWVQWATVAVAAVSFAAATLLSLFVGQLPPAQIEAWELAGAILGVLLLVTTASAIALAVRDFLRAHGSSTPGVYSVSQRLLVEAGVRVLGKGCLAATLIALYGARHWLWLQHFFHVHPLAFFLLVLEATVLLTLAHVFTAVWDHEFDKEQRQDGRS